MRLSSSNSRMRSTSRKGWRWGRIFLMSSSSRGRRSSTAMGALVYNGRSETPVLRWLVRPGATTRAGPPLPSEPLGDLLPLIGEINTVLDPDALLSAIARQLRRIVDFRILDIFLPGPDGYLHPAYVEGYEREKVVGFKARPGDGIVGTAA